jgi:hypothetical protein
MLCDLYCNPTKLTKPTKTMYMRLILIQCKNLKRMSPTTSVLPCKQQHIQETFVKDVRHLLLLMEDISVCSA